MDVLQGVDPAWIENITQIETTDPVEGGADGIDNAPHRQLAARTAYLKQLLETHGHTMDDVTDLVLALAGKAPLTHGHALLDVEDLVEALDQKSPTGHHHVPEDIDGLESGLPVGTVTPFAGAAPPSGWLLCNGAAVSRVTYSRLYAAIGVTWGAGDGATTFNLPDLRGRFPIGAGAGTNLTSRALGATGGEEEHTLISDEMPAHFHQIGGQDNLAEPSGTRSDEIANVENPSNWTNTPKNTSTVGGGDAHNNMPPFIALNFIVKA
jgi:microcystin-dependent protein